LPARKSRRAYRPRIVGNIIMTQADPAAPQ